MKYKNLIKNRTLIYFFIANGLLLFMLVYSIPHLEKLSAGMKILDVKPTGYSTKYVNELFAKIGTNGRFFYLTTQLVIDIFYPLFFALAYSGIIKSLLKPSRIKQILGLMPYAVMTLDYLENIGIAAMLINFPEQLNLLVTLTNTFTIGKSLFSLVVFSCILIAGLPKLIQFVNSKL